MRYLNHVKLALEGYEVGIRSVTIDDLLCAGLALDSHRTYIRQVICGHFRNALPRAFSLSSHCHSERVLFGYRGALYVDVGPVNCPPALAQHAAVSSFYYSAHLGDD